MQQTMAWLSSIEEVVEDAKAGKMFILVDDEGRENEGDLVIPAQMANADAVNFMAKHGRGLICLSMTQDRVEELGLHLMAQKNLALHQTAFTVSIEAREGVTTGISAADRAQTIAVAIDPRKGRRDIVTPGHIFPLVAQDGGVLVRAGHTEAAVDIARMAGLNPAGVICEIMNDDGTMARMPDLVTFAQLHGLKIATIADLIAYRRRNERLINLVSESRINSRFGGDFRIRVYSNTVEYAEHIALIRGDISGDAPVLVRMHQANIMADSLGDITPGEFYGGDRAPAQRRTGGLDADDRRGQSRRRGVHPRNRADVHQPGAEGARGRLAIGADLGTAAIWTGRANPARSRIAESHPAVEHPAQHRRPRRLWVDRRRPAVDTRKPVPEIIAGRWAQRGPSRNETAAADQPEDANA